MKRPRAVHYSGGKLAFINWILINIHPYLFPPFLPSLLSVAMPPIHSAASLWIFSDLNMSLWRFWHRCSPGSATCTELTQLKKGKMFSILFQVPPFGCQPLDGPLRYRKTYTVTPRFPPIVTNRTGSLMFALYSLKCPAGCDFTTYTDPRSLQLVGLNPTVSYLDTEGFPSAVHCRSPGRVSCSESDITVVFLSPWIYSSI